MSNVQIRLNPELEVISGILYRNKDYEFIRQLSRDPYFQILNQIEYHKDYAFGGVTISISFQVQKKNLEKIRPVLNECFVLYDIPSDYNKEYYVI